MSAVALIFFGDAGTSRAPQYEVGAAVAAWCAQHPCDFVALLGDNFYPTGVDSVNDPGWDRAYLKPYSAINLPFYPALGNHDYLGSVRAQLRFEDPTGRWLPDGRRYTFSVGDADFFVIDTQRRPRSQRRWLTRKLRRSTAPWKVVYGHKPFRSAGKHGGDATLEAQLLPVLTAYGVQFYLAGHDHHAEVRSGTPTQVVMGTGGAELRPVAADPAQLYAESAYGFGYLLLDDKEATLQVVGSDGAPRFEYRWPRTDPAPGQPASALNPGVGP